MTDRDALLDAVYAERTAEIQADAAHETIFVFGGMTYPLNVELNRAYIEYRNQCTWLRRHLADNRMGRA